MPGLRQRGGGGGPGRYLVDDKGTFFNPFDRGLLQNCLSFWSRDPSPDWSEVFQRRMQVRLFASSLRAAMLSARRASCDLCIACRLPARLNILCTSNTAELPRALADRPLINHNMWPDKGFLSHA